MADETLKLDGQGGVQVALGGDIIHWSTAEQGGAGEIVGILVAAFVLFLTLGVVAMGLPLLNALFAMIVSLSIMAVVGTRVLDVVDWTPQLATMLGIGVGIDYALLILNRFRLERGAGRDVREATLISIDTSGRAVLFAGIVVVIAMLGMLLLGISFLYGPAIGAALAVLVTILASLTLMPAVLSKIGGRVKPAKNGGDGPAISPTGAGLRRALERVRGAPSGAGGDPRARRAPRARGARAAHALGDERREHLQEGRHDARRLRPAEGGLRRRLQRPAAARRRAAAGGRRGRAHADLRRAWRAGRHRTGPPAAAQRPRGHGDDDRLPDDHAAGRADRRDREDGAQRDVAADRTRRPARACPSAGPRRRTSTSRRRSATNCRSSSASWSACRCCCSWSCSAAS